MSEEEIKAFVVAAAGRDARRRGTALGTASTVSPGSRCRGTSRSSTNCRTRPPVGSRSRSSHATATTRRSISMPDDEQIDWQNPDDAWLGSSIGATDADHIWIAGRDITDADGLDDADRARLPAARRPSADRRRMPHHRRRPRLARRPRGDTEFAVDAADLHGRAGSGAGCDRGRTARRGQCVPRSGRRHRRLPRRRGRPSVA